MKVNFEKDPLLRIRVGIGLLHTSVSHKRGLYGCDASFPDIICLAVVRYDLRFFPLFPLISHTSSCEVFFVILASQRIFTLARGRMLIKVMETRMV
jgi:hypothetical protein